MNPWRSSVLQLLFFNAASGASSKEVVSKRLRGAGDPSSLLAPNADEQRTAPKYLYVLNGYTKKHNLLLQQGKTLISSGANVTASSILLTSDVATVLSADPLLETARIRPLHYCSPPSCNNPEGDDKFLGAALLANTTRHGFQWLLLGDDDTTFFARDIEQALSVHDPSKPHYFAMQVDPYGAKMKDMPLQYRGAIERCPPSGNHSGLRYAARNPDKQSRQQVQASGDSVPCDPDDFRDDSWFQWGYGGNGLVLSAGLLDEIASSKWQTCVDRITSFGGDVRISMCLAFLGHRVELLTGLANQELTAHKLTEQELHELDVSVH